MMKNGDEIGVDAPIKLATAGLVVWHQNRLLLAFSKHKLAWYLPGGKVDEGETALAALCRECWEELGCRLKPNDVQYYRHISAPAYGEPKHTVMEQECFMANWQGDLPQPQAEIGAVRYFSWAEYGQLAVQVPGVVQLYGHLQHDFGLENT